MNQFDGVPSPAPARTGDIAFDRRTQGLTGIVVKGFLLSLVTFSIYRFWYITNLRRYFWSRTVVAGSPAEYLGNGKELFLGFLVALAVLVPVYIVLFVVGLLSPILAALAAPISFIGLFVLGQYALFRGRRYRASRTRWRGIRLGQDGSGFAYAGLASLWWLGTILSLGLAFPFMRAALERYRIDHTLVGQSRMRSTATGRSILLPWMMFYIVALLPTLLSILALLAATGFDIPSDLLIQDPANEKSKLIFNPAYEDTPFASYGAAVVIAASVSIPLALLLIPYYRARETRAFFNAAHLGEARLTSSLKARRFYVPYLVYMLAVIGFILVLGIIFALLVPLIATDEQNPGIHAFVIASTVLLYLGAILGTNVLYVRIVTVRLWHAVATTTQIENLPALEAVLASTRAPASGLNEGLADALDVGGALEIGF
ncbi:YjgN family protein [Methylorubrum populi]|uniref:Membran protein n=1 Tax=Methylorubrum populi TaxID=223967 RepID=A0A833J8Z5_9HYPH|nr:YjgN family protein [Methylorubrum populi]KAB7785506.1 membran protein [Methylorubrum populi]